MINDSLAKFHPVVQAWFTKTFGNPSPPQQQGWKPISEGEHSLIVAPTGSGKTLAAFMWCINHIVEENIVLANVIASSREVEAKYSHGGKKKIVRRSDYTIISSDGTSVNDGIRVLYVSPLKALNNDIHRNLEIPLQGIAEEARNQHIDFIPIRSAVRTGDTTQSERASMLRNPPDILITTPESLYLMLSSEKARKMFATVQYVIVDEIHSISNNKRGVHLSITLERLEELIAHVRNDGKKSFVRIGLSATQKPLEEVARFLGGFDYRDEKYIPREVTIIDAGYKKNVDLEVICPVIDFSDMPFDSAWNPIYPKLLDLISKHKTTLIFVNSRRVAERLSGKLNEMLEGQSDTFNNYAVPVFEQKKFPLQESHSPMRIFAYHGSMSRDVREKLEKDLKSGSLRCLVTTSALELGIDIGSVDLVVQIQSSKGIARGLQRIGRSGHLVSAQSKGRIIVTHRDDLLESIIVAKAMKDHDIERTSIPKNCLDVLAQQIVSMVSVEDWNADDLFTLFRRSYNYNTLTKKIYHAILDMLAGRYTNEAFRELRARIMWDKLHNTLSALPGSSKLAITNAGTIPDRGYFGVYLEDRKTKVGEVDEEFIYESRAGDTFILGSNVWRMMDIDANKVVVSPAPGQPARMPFWKGESIGRTYELSIKVGEFLENLSSQSHADKSQHRIQKDSDIRRNDHAHFSLENFPIDHHSARNIVAYISEQKEATQIVPSHNTIVVEGFRDEIGDPRIVVHSLYGRSINGLLGVVLHHELQRRLGIEVQMLYNDNGILFRCSDVERLPLDIISSLSLQSAQQILIEKIPSSPLFGALFRQNAERAMLLPKGLPGKRRPFFLQRMKAADLLQIVKQYGDFPIVIETMRECLNDVLDLEHFKEIFAKLENGDIRVHTVQTDIPSPFASSLLFDFAAVYMYESDDPKNVGKQQVVSLNRELLSDVVHLDNYKTVVRNDAIGKIEDQLQFTSMTKKARSREELMEVFLRLGELTEAEILARAENKAWIEDLKARHIIIPIEISARQYFILTEEFPLYKSISKSNEAMGISIPEQFRRSAFERNESLRFVIARTLRTHGPLHTSYIADRFSISLDECESILRLLSSDEQFVHGSFVAEISDEQWCYRPNLERIHRASITMLRKEIKPATIADFMQFLLHWQHRHPSTHEENEEGLQSLIEQFEGYAVQPELWESEIFRSRMRHYDPAFVRRLVSRGETICVGTLAGKSQWIVRGDGHFFIESKEAGLENLSTHSQEVYTFLKESGASFLSDIREGMNLSLAVLNRSLSELFWHGLITNDVADEFVNIKRYRTVDEIFPAERFEIVNPRRNPIKSVAMKRVRTALKQVPGWNGRWSLVHTRSVLGAAVSDEEKIQRQAQQLLARYGIVAREIAKREENLLPWPLLAMEFQRMEMRGEIRRGYFIEGLSGMQFAIPEAVNMIESIKQPRKQQEVPIVLNACDPANPFGTGIDFGNLMTALPRISRFPSNYIISERGFPILWIENYGARLYLLTEANADTVRAGLTQFINHMRIAYPHKNDIVIEYCDALRPSESSLAELLRSVGFYRDKIQTMKLDLR